MPTDLRQIETIAILMMENRSFDHFLGYLSLPPWNRNRKPVDGLRLDPAWEARYSNWYGGQGYPPAPLQVLTSGGDAPHDRWAVGDQVGTAPGAAGTMTRFVESYMRGPTPPYDAGWTPPTDPGYVMGYYTPAQVPMCDFFAQQYAVCDAWFSSLPSSTQPNRLMFMSGIATEDNNAAGLLIPDLPDQPDLVYDWLTQRGISWRLYYDGFLPFLALMPRWRGAILHDGDHFRRFDDLAADVHGDTLPSVLFLEPQYTDGLHRHAPNDDHAPTPVDHGQRFLRAVYGALTANPDRWAKTLLIVTYDEHGGFFDHVDPPALPTLAPAGEYPPFDTLGVRVPAFIVSPLVEPGDVYSTRMDHTSILAFLAEWAGARTDPPGDPHYSPEVDQRQQAGLGHLAPALTRAAPRPEIPRPPLLPGDAPDQPTAAAVHAAARDLHRQDPEAARKTFPFLWDGLSAG